MSEFKDMPAVECVPVREIFATDLISVEHFGNFVRLTFGVPDKSANYSEELLQMLVVAKVVVPPGALVDMIEGPVNPISVTPGRPRMFERPTAPIKVWRYRGISSQS